MGTDIHMRCETRNPDGTWSLVTEPRWPHPWDGRSVQPYVYRNYNAFAVLANVRNGRGFAGVVTGLPVLPITMPRGLPEDISPELRWNIDAPNTDIEEAGWDSWLGDHSHSYLTLAELLAYDWDLPKTHVGVVDLPTYEKWKTSGEIHPDFWSADVSGGGVKVVAESEVRPGSIIAVDHLAQSVYVRCTWKTTIAQSVRSFYPEVTDSLVALAAERGLGHKDIRIVFGFDS